MKLLKAIGKGLKSIAGPIISGAASLIGGHSAAKAEEKANAQNVALQRENQDWEERMSNTQYQRATQDMLKAGLNPMLAYSQGGAGTPTTSAATVEPVEGMAKAINSAGSKAMEALAQQQIAANIDLTRANASKARSEAAVSAASVGEDISGRAMANDLLRAQVQESWARRDLTTEQRDQLIQMLPYLQQLNDAQTTSAYASANSAQSAARASDSTAELNKVRRIAETLGLSEAEADSAYWETVKAGGKAAPRGMAILQTLMQMLRSKK